MDAILVTNRAKVVKLQFQQKTGGESELRDRNLRVERQERFGVTRLKILEHELERTTRMWRRIKTPDVPWLCTR